VCLQLSFALNVPLLQYIVLLYPNFFKLIHGFDIVDVQQLRLFVVQVILPELNLPICFLGLYARLLGFGFGQVCPLLLHLKFLWVVAESNLMHPFKIM